MIEEFGKLKFLEPNYFYLIIFFALILYFFYRKNIKSSYFGFFEDIKKIYKKNSYFYRFYYVLLFAMFVFYIFIFANPIIENTKENMKKNGIDIEIIFDVSYSMVAEDLPPNRLEVAKSVIIDFLDKQVNNRIGIIVFSGKPFRSLPLNFDYEIIKKIVSSLTINILDQNVYELQGTAIGDALVMGVDNLVSDNAKDVKRKKVIILITDGEANKGLDPILALKYAKDKNIKIYTIGLGGDKKTFVNMTNQFGFSQKIEIGGVDEKTLQKIANETGGKYFRANTKGVLGSIFNEINNLEKREFKVDILKINKEDSRVFLFKLLFLVYLFLILKWVKNID